MIEPRLTSVILLDGSQLDFLISVSYLHIISHISLNYLRFLLIHFTLFLFRPTFWRVISSIWSRLILPYTTKTTSDYRLSTRRNWTTLIIYLLIESQSYRLRLCFLLLSHSNLWSELSWDTTNNAALIFH